MRAMTKERLEWLLTHPTTEWEIGDDVEVVRMALKYAAPPEGGQRVVSEYEYEQSRRILKWGERMIVATRGRRPEVTVDLVVRGLDELAALLQSPMNARGEK
jgi:hypothetical protein